MFSSSERSPFVGNAHRHHDGLAHIKHRLFSALSIDRATGGLELRPCECAPVFVDRVFKSAAGITTDEEIGLRTLCAARGPGAAVKFNGLGVGELRIADRQVQATV